MNVRNLEKRSATGRDVIVIKEPSKLFGFLSLIFGLLSVFILSVLFVPLGVLFSFLGFLKRDLANSALSGIGLVFSVIGLLTSPMLLSLIGLGFMK
jgi:hypothetical protein